MRPFDVQLAAGVVMHQGGLAELATGEGKTLTAVAAGLSQRPGRQGRSRRHRQRLPGPPRRRMDAADLRGPGPDASASCSSRWASRTASGLPVRRHLRHRLRVRLRLPARPAQGGRAPGPRGAVLGAVGQGQRLHHAAEDANVQRPHHFALVDEADNIFIDEARTPLIISKATRPATAEEQVVYHWADETRQEDGRERTFHVRPEEAEAGADRQGQAADALLQPAASGGGESSAMDKLQEHVEQALQAHYRFRRDQHYMIDKGKIVIIDEFTGPQNAGSPVARRPASGRRGQGRTSRSTRRRTTRPRSRSRAISGCTRSWPA